MPRTRWEPPYPPNPGRGTGHTLQQVVANVLAGVQHYALKPRRFRRFVDYAAALMGLSSRTVQNYARQAGQPYPQPEPHDQQMVVLSSDANLFTARISADQSEVVRSYIDTLHEQGHQASVPSLLEVVNRHGPPISARTLRRALHDLGYTWDTHRRKTSLRASRKGLRMLESMIRVLDDNKRSTDPMPVMSQDESFVKACHRMEFTWGITPQDDFVTGVGMVVRPRPNGTFILMGSVSDQDGVLETNIIHRHRALGDYHKGITFVDFKEYMEYFVFHHEPPDGKEPGSDYTLKPREPHILLLDNAKYHHTIDWPEWVLPKDSAYKYPMRNEQVTKALAWASDVPWTQEFHDEQMEWAKKRVEELASPGKLKPQRSVALRERLRAVQIPWVERRAKELGWKVVWLPPGWSALNPIERVWAYVKNMVARGYSNGRTEHHLHEQIVEAATKVEGDKHYAESAFRYAESQMEIAKMWKNTVLENMQTEVSEGHELEETDDEEDDDLV